MFAILGFVFDFDLFAVLRLFQKYVLTVKLAGLGFPWSQIDLECCTVVKGGFRCTRQRR
jgi:hypothetical protein